MKRMSESFLSTCSSGFLYLTGLPQVLLEECSSAIRLRILSSISFTSTSRDPKTSATLVSDATKLLLWAFYLSITRWWRCELALWIHYCTSNSYYDLLNVLLRHLAPLWSKSLRGKSGLLLIPARSLGIRWHGSKSIPLRHLLSNIFWFYQISVLILSNICFCCIKHLFVVSNILNLYRTSFTFIMVSFSCIKYLYLLTYCTWHWFVKGRYFVPKKPGRLNLMVLKRKAWTLC